MVVVVWIIFAIVLGIWVDRRGRSGILAAFLAVFLSPLVMWIIHLAIGPKIIAPEQNAYNGPIPASEPPVNFEATKRCPACAEVILQAARKCKHCGEQLEAVTG
jgi:hypothetical protein